MLILKNNYELYTKEELISEIQSLKESKRYGLVWEDYTEEADLITNPNFEFSDEFSFSAETSDNPIKHEVLEGDNLLALKHLEETHLGKIDVIYIDPPYNTGNEFVYNDKIVDKEDNFRHSKWLSFMCKRLKLAKSLLGDNGVIFVSIDDNEQAQLKLLMDDIFGEHNFIGNCIRKTRTAISDHKNGINTQHEYTLIYAKNNLNLVLNGKEKDFSKYRNPDNDINGDWIADNPTAASGSQSSIFEIINPYTNEIYLPPNQRYWAFSQETFKRWVASGKVVFPQEKNKRFTLKKYKKELKSRYNLRNSLDFAENNYINSSGTKEIRAFDIDGFNYPKPTSFIKELLLSFPNKNATVLDFFAGSGTTGHAVMELNKEDGGNRKFILCTNNEVSEEKVRQHFINQGVLDKNTKTAFTKFRQENEEVVNQFYETEEYQKLGIARSVTYERLKRVIEGYTTPKGKFVEGLKGNRFDYFIASSKI